MPNYIKEIEAGGVLYKTENRKKYFSLIHRRKQGDWTLPKGHCEKGESLENCALREVNEETGWQGKIVGFCDSFVYNCFDKKIDIHYERTVYFYLIKIVKLNPDYFISKEVTEIVWLPLDLISLEKMTYNNDKSIVKKAISLLN